jgi:hypothetical protein
VQQICQKIKLIFILISAGYNSVWSDEWVAVKILEESVNFFDKKSATTSRAGGVRMFPGRGRGRFCWWPLIFNYFFISVLSDLLDLMTT